MKTPHVDTHFAFAILVLVASTIGFAFWLTNQNNTDRTVTTPIKSELPTLQNDTLEKSAPDYDSSEYSIKRHLEHESRSEWVEYINSSGTFKFLHPAHCIISEKTDHIIADCTESIKNDGDFAGRIVIDFKNTSLNKDLVTATCFGECTDPDAFPYFYTWRNIGNQNTLKENYSFDEGAKITVVEYTTDKYINIIHDPAGPLPNRSSLVGIMTGRENLAFGDDVTKDFEEKKRLQKHGWTLTKGFYRNTCSHPAYSGDTSIEGYAVEESNYSGPPEKLFRVLEKDFDKIPFINENYPHLNIAYNKIHLIKPGSSERPTRIEINRFSGYCEGSPTAYLKDNVDMTDWKTFVDPKYRYLVKYPEDTFQFRENTKGEELFVLENIENKELGIVVKTSNEEQTKETLLELFPKSKISELYIANQGFGQLVQMTTEEGHQKSTFYVGNEDSRYVITAISDGSPELESTAFQIVDSILL